MSEYTPDTEDVRDYYGRDIDGWPEAKRGAEFDRWLAAHDREVAAKALRNWITEWPVSPGDRDFLGSVARDGLARADRIEAGGSDAH